MDQLVLATRRAQAQERADAAAATLAHRYDLDEEAAQLAEARRRQAREPQIAQLLELEAVATLLERLVRHAPAASRDEVSELREQLEALTTKSETLEAQLAELEAQLASQPPAAPAAAAEAAPVVPPAEQAPAEPAQAAVAKKEQRPSARQ